MSDTPKPTALVSRQIEKEAHYLTQELWLQRDSHSRTLADLDQQQAELEESYKEAQDSNRKQHQAAQVPPPPQPPFH